MAQPEAFTPAKIQEVQDYVQNRILPVQGFLFDTEAGTSASKFIQIPFYLELTSTLIDDYTLLLPHLPFDEIYTPTLHLLFDLREHLVTLEERGPGPTHDFHPDSVKTASGRKRYDVPANILEAYVDEGFRNAEIAGLLGVSQSWVKREKKRLGLRRRDRQTEISDNELEEVVRELKENGAQYIGEVGMEAALKEMGITVPRQRLREAIAVCDADGVVARWLRAVRRRRYSVPFINSLWHLDGMSCLLFPTLLTRSYS